MTNHFKQVDEAAEQHVLEYMALNLDRILESTENDSSRLDVRFNSTKKRWELLESSQMLSFS